MGETYNYRIDVWDGITTKSEEGSIITYCSGTTNICSQGAPCSNCRGSGTCTQTSRSCSTSGTSSKYIDCNIGSRCQQISGVNNPPCYPSVTISCSCGYIYGSRGNVCTQCMYASYPARSHTCARCNGSGGTKCTHGSVNSHYICSHNSNGGKH